MTIGATEGGTGGGRILIVEDESVISLVLESMLVDAGYEVAAIAETVAEALAAVDRTPVDAAILDLNLKGKKVYPVAEKLAAAGVPFIFSTGEGFKVEGFENHPQIRKPFRDAELLEAIAQILPGKPAK